MKRAVLGALLISLVAGSTAFAGAVLAPNRGDHHQQRQSDHRGDQRRHDDNRRRDNHVQPNIRGRGNDHGNHWNQRNDHHQDGRRGNFRPNDNYRNPHHFHDDRRWVSPPRHDHRWERGRWHWGSYYRPYGYAPHYWRRGERLPRVYYAPRYVITNYYDCGLRAPPYGYHWVRVDHDVVLAAIATGIVLDVIYNQFW